MVSYLMATEDGDVASVKASKETPASTDGGIIDDVDEEGIVDEPGPVADVPLIPVKLELIEDSGAVVAEEQMCALVLASSVQFGGATAAARGSEAPKTLCPDEATAPLVTCEFCDTQALACSRRATDKGGARYPKSSA